MIANISFINYAIFIPDFETQIQFQNLNLSLELRILNQIFWSSIKQETEL